MNSPGRFVWTTLRCFWPRWADVLAIVKPATAVGRHCAAFHLCWRWRCRPRGGRPKINHEILGLIRRLAADNPDWGVPKIHRELQKPGFIVSERTVARCLRQVERRGDPGKRWLTFLQNHREVLVAFDAFTAPTVIFQLLYCLFVIAHGRRKILYFNVTRQPTADRVVRQLREAFPQDSPCRHVILDRDSRFDSDVIAFLKAAGLKPKRTSVQAPWHMGSRRDGVGAFGAKSWTLSLP